MTEKEDILKLKEKRNAVILAHNYQPPEIQDIADFVGDSLELSRKAAATDAEVIVFCGVLFMAETAKILSPRKTVLMPEINAGCPMADMLTAEQLKKLKSEHPGATVVCYVNSSAEVKAGSDVCCTSANAVELVRNLDAEEIIFVPDKYLGDYASKQTGKKLILWNGYCPVHVMILPEHIKKAKAQHPKALALAHPECTPETIAVADKALSTGGMIRLAKESPKKEFIIGTEVGIIHRLKKENPGKLFYPATEPAVCRNMRKTDLSKLYLALKTLEHKIEVPEEIAKKARSSIDKMLEAV